MSRRTATIWTFAITSVALFMTTLDNLVVTTALPVIHRDLHASLSGLEWTVNAYTLTFAVFLITGAALGDRFGRRRMFVIGLAIFTAGSAAAALAPSIEALIVARAVQGFGGAIVLPLTLTILSAAVPAEKRGPRARRLGRHQRPRGRDRPAGRRRGRPGHLLAVDLLAERADRPCADPARPRCGCRRAVARTTRSTCPASASPASACSGSSGALCAGTQVGWGSAEIVFALVAGTGRARAVRALGAAHRGADAAAALLPQPHLHRRKRRLAADVLRDVRLDLPAGAVLPDRAGLLAAAGRPADPPVDGDADLRRSDRRRALGPDRRPAADGHGARAAGGRARVDRGGLDARRSPTRRSSCRSSSPASGWRSTSRRSRTSCSRRCGRRRKARPRAPTTRSASSAASSAWPCSPRCSPTTAATALARPSSTGSIPALYVGAGFVAAGAVAALGIARKVRRQEQEAPAARASG